MVGGGWEKAVGELIMYPLTNLSCRVPMIWPLIHMTATSTLMYRIRERMSKRQSGIQYASQATKTCAFDRTGGSKAGSGGNFEYPRSG